MSSRAYSLKQNKIQSLTLTWKDYLEFEFIKEVDEGDEDGMEEEEDVVIIGIVGGGTGIQ